MYLESDRYDYEVFEMERLVHCYGYEPPVAWAYVRLNNWWQAFRLALANERQARGWT